MQTELPRSRSWLAALPRPGASGALVIGAALAAVGLARSPQGTPPNTPQTQAVPVLGGSATANSNQRVVAVTGVDVTGSSVLYLIDTQTMRLCVYQASSTGSNQGIRFVGARRIELDVELNGYNDKSQFTYAAVLSEFEKKGLIPPSGTAADGAPDLSTGDQPVKRP
jgi:hypothetical protein